MARRYQKIKELLPKIKEKLAAGETQKEVAKHFGLEGGRKTIQNLLTRERLQQQKIPKQRGRKPAVTLQEYKYETKRLKMENELLRSFLRAAGRM